MTGFNELYISNCLCQSGLRATAFTGYDRLPTHDSRRERDIRFQVNKYARALEQV